MPLDKNWTAPIAAGIVALVVALSGAELQLALLAGAVTGVTVKVFERFRKSESGGSDDLDEADAAAIYASLTADVADFNRNAEQLAPGETQQLVQRIGQQFEQIVGLLDRPAQGAPAQRISGELIGPAQATLTEYQYLLNKELPQAQDIRNRIASRDLPAIEYAARSTKTLLQREGPIDLTALERALQFQLDGHQETSLSGPETWGNRSKIVADANRENK